MDVVYVDAGNGLVPPARVNHGSLGEAERIKAGLILETMAADGVDAMVFGEEDWRLGRAFLDAHASELPVLAANLVCDGEAPYPASLTVERGGLTVGIVGVTAGEVEGCEVGEPLPALEAAARALAAVDLVVALVPYRFARLREDESELGVDLFVTGGEPVRYDDLRAWRGGYKAAAGGKTKYVGKVVATLAPGASEWAVDPTREVSRELEKTRALRDRVQGRLDKATEEAQRARYAEMIARYDEGIAEGEAELAAIAEGEGRPMHRFDNEILSLDEGYADHEATAARVMAAKARITEVATAGEDMGALAKVPRVIPGEGAWAGSDRCQGCHTEQHTQWVRTPHARAYAGLVDVDRAMDPECFSCHVTGAHAEGGPAVPTLVGPFRDVQCESCHGPSGEHARAPGTAPHPVKTPSEAVCTACHDGERDMGRFEIERYMPRVEH